MNLKGSLFDKFSVFKRKASIFLDNLELNILKIKDWFNKLILKGKKIINYKSKWYLNRCYAYEDWEDNIVMKVKDWFNKQANNVLDIIALLKDIIGLKIENYRINRIIKLEKRIGNIKGKIKYQ